MTEGQKPVKGHMVRSRSAMYPIMIKRDICVKHCIQVMTPILDGGDFKIQGKDILERKKYINEDVAGHV